MSTTMAKPSIAVLPVSIGNVLRRFAVRMLVLGRRVDAWLAARFRAAQDRAALAQMSDRELHDIGISRGSVEPIASGTWLRDH